MTKLKPVIFNNTVLRDGHQSLAATRMRTEQMVPALAGLDAMGFGALETWGGATIDSGLRFLDEFPFDRLDALKRGAPQTPHMMLLRGQNIVQYQNFPDDVVEAFVRTSAAHGMNIFRIFDALNDLRNIETAVRAARDAGAHAQGVICYTSSPVHTLETFVNLGVEIERMGCHSICLKDMAGLIPPGMASGIIKELKRRCEIPVVIHSHETAGLAASTYYAAIEAGVDMIDTSIAPFANGTGQPDTLQMLSLLEGHPRCPELDRSALHQLGDHFRKVYAELSEFTSHRNEVVDNDALIYQVPGGMLSNFRNQLKEQGMADRFDEVFAEIPVVREALGWIPLVTPTSQIVGVQAMLNVRFGRWVNFSPQAMDIALGYYGRTPGPVDAEVQQLAKEKLGKPPIDVRPGDLANPRMETIRKELAALGIPNDDEHCVIHAMFPRELIQHYERKSAPPPTAPRETISVPAAPAPSPPAENRSLLPTDELVSTRMRLAIDGTSHDVTIEELEVEVTGENSH